MIVDNRRALYCQVAWEKYDCFVNFTWQLIIDNNNDLRNILGPDQNGGHFADIFKLIFLYAQLLYFDCNFNKMCSQMSNSQEISVGSGNELTPNKRQALILNNSLS